MQRKASSSWQAGTQRAVTNHQALLRKVTAAFLAPQLPHLIENLDPLVVLHEANDVGGRPLLHVAGAEVCQHGGLRCRELKQPQRQRRRRPAAAQVLPCDGGAGRGRCRQRDGDVAGRQGNAVGRHAGNVRPGQTHARASESEGDVAGRVVEEVLDEAACCCQRAAVAAGGQDEPRLELWDGAGTTAGAAGSEAYQSPGKRRAPKAHLQQGLRLQYSRTRSLASKHPSVRLHAPAELPRCAPADPNNAACGSRVDPPYLVHQKHRWLP